MTTIRAVYVTAALASAACASHAPPRTATSPSAAIRQLQADLTSIFNAPIMARGVWGVDIRWLDSGEILFQQNPDRLMMPASNMKILTLAAAAESLGWDHRFTTTLETDAPVENGILAGDLIIRGNGDPTISGRGNRARTVFDEWVAALRAAGITEVQGRIVGDDQAFDDEGLGPGWAWDYLEAGYASPTGALQYNENAAELTVAPSAIAGEPAIVRLESGSGLTLVNLVRTVPSDAHVASGFSRTETGFSRTETGVSQTEPPRSSVNVHRRVDRPLLQITGTIPVGAPAITRTVAVVNPTLFFAQGVKEALSTRGIPVRGDAMDADDLAGSLATTPNGRRVLIATPSPTLREIGAVLMKVSQNQYAETLLKALGARRGGLGTTDAGRAAAIETFTAWNIPADAYVMSDGSGLSRYNYAAPSTITSVLRRMHADVRHREAFQATLPVAGKDGTIATRMSKTRAVGNAVAKTGSIANVRSLSGFVRTRDGETLVFSIIANDFVIPAATISWAADLAVETLSNVTRR